MSSEAKKAIGIGLAILGLILLALALGVAMGARGCGQRFLAPPTTGIDAGPGDDAIGQRLDAALQTEEERIRELEAAHAAEIAAMSEQERRDYDAARARGRDSLAIWLKERTARLLGDAGPAALW